MNENDKERVKALVVRGAQIAGSATGALLGSLSVGPLGAAAGAAAGEMLGIAIEFSYRQLSEREQARVGAGLAFAYDKIRHRQDEGRALRSDGFFDPDLSGRSASDEIFEGVLLKCKSEHEEKKARHIGNIYANVAFMPDISVQEANYLLHLAERLTYRQLCVIALVQRATEVELGIAWGHLFSQQQEDSSFMAELRELSGLVHGMGNTSEPPFLEPLGLMAYEAMSLEDIPTADLHEVAKLIHN